MNGPSSSSSAVASSAPPARPERRLLQNIAALSFLQVVMLVLPLLTVPFLTRVMGVDAWGRFALAQVVLNCFCQITAWGFGWSATRKVSALRHDHDALARVLVATWQAQWLLGLAALLVLVPLILCLPFLRADSSLYAAGAGMIIGGVLFPSWFFSGLERMRESAWMQIVARVVVVALTFMLIRGPQDVVLLMAITSLGAILPGVFGLYWLRSHFRIDWRASSLRAALAELRDGATLFLSTLSVSFYTTAVPVLLGALAGPAAVAYYSLADRARQAGNAVLAPIAQALFPRMSLLFAQDRAAALHLLRRSGALIVLVALCLSATLWLAAPLIIKILGGQAFLPAVIVLRWLAVLPLVVSLSNIFGVQIMLPNHENRAFTLILGGAGLLSLLIMQPLIAADGALGAALSALITELAVTLAMAIYLARRGYFSCWTRPPPQGTMSGY